MFQNYCLTQWIWFSNSIYITIAAYYIIFADEQHISKRRMTPNLNITRHIQLYQTQKNIFCSIIGLKRDFQRDMPTKYQNIIEMKKIYTRSICLPSARIFTVCSIFRLRETNSFQLNEMQRRLNHTMLLWI